MLRRLYDWTLNVAGSRRAEPVLFIVAFLESSFFPIPPDIMVVPMVLANRARAWRIAAICTLGSVLGGIVGYLIGAFLFDLIGAPILEWYGNSDRFDAFAGMYNEWGAWIVFGAGITPFPYKVITIASGATALEPMVFIVASILARGLRFFLVAALIWQFGPPIQTFIERRLGIVTGVFFMLLVGGFAVLKLLM
jgi:membrane protein YqaA with SNARE-associated domain